MDDSGFADYRVDTVNLIITALRTVIRGADFYAMEDNTKFFDIYSGYDCPAGGILTRQTKKRRGGK